MAWHSVVISNPAKLSRHNFSLRIEQEEAAQVPFEDIAIIVLNHQAISLTHPVLSACAEYGVGLFSTGENYQPNGVFMPFLPHSRTVKVMRQQMALDKPTAKRTWTHLVRSKIANQAECLELASQTGADYLRAMAQKVRSGDPDNIEAQASAFYFRTLFGKGFNRASEVRTNAALNYGYAILRGTIARVLVAHGFLPALGLHHHSEQNAFNLADDLIEPFRPLVDLFVRLKFQENNKELNPKDKSSLVGLLHYDLAVDTGNSTTLVAIDKCVTSLARVIEQSNSDLISLPRLISLRVHEDES
ncbi:type II CRISPR-associated endonuclease Cas1 [soil metagenome]